MASLKKTFSEIISRNKHLFPTRRVLIILIGTAILSFGIVNLHRRAAITEGGVLGMILLLNHWLEIAPSLVSPFLDILCYALAFRTLGKDFLKVSAFATLSLASFFSLWEHLPPLLPDLSAYPLLAAIVGGGFVGVGVGLVVRQGGSTGGDDALALAISKLTGCRISLAYLATDLTVLLLSLSYIPLQRIAYSIVTVTFSSFLIDQIKDFHVQKNPNIEAAEKPGDDAKNEEQPALEPKAQKHPAD